MKTTINVTWRGESLRLYLRSQHSTAVAVRASIMEQALRAQFGWGPDEPLSAYAQRRVAVGRACMVVVRAFGTVSGVNLAAQAAHDVRALLEPAMRTARIRRAVLHACREAGPA